jgi:UDP-glucose 4-epimerase
MNSIKILVTGGAGNVGGALVRKLVENPNYFVVIADNLIICSLLLLRILEMF